MADSAPLWIAIAAVAAILAVPVTRWVQWARSDLAKLSPAERKRHCDIEAAEQLIEDARQAVLLASTPRTLARLGRWTVTETAVRIEAYAGRPAVEYPLTEGIKVKVKVSGTVDTDTNYRTIRTRRVTSALLGYALLGGAAGATAGALLAPKRPIAIDRTTDNRTVSVRMKGPDWWEYLTVRGDELAAADSFEWRVETASVLADQRWEEFTDRLLRAQAQLAEAQAGRALLGRDPLSDTASRKRAAA